jgi:hypothetical protein
MRIKRSTLTLWKKRFALFCIVASVISLLFVYFKTSIFTITAYELVGVPDMYRDALVAQLKTVSSQKFFGFIPADKILDYRTTKIKEVVVGALPSSQAVKIAPVGLHTIRIKVTSYQPLFKIDDTHAISEDGYIYAESKDMSSLVLLSVASSTKRESKNDGVVSVSMTGIDKTTLSGLVSLITKVDSIIFKVSKIEIDEFDDVSLFDQSGISRIMYVGDANIDKVWSTLVSAIDTDPLKSKLEKNKGNLEYLDARFGNKVFYKFTNDIKTDIIQNHATTTEATTTLH